MADLKCKKCGAQLRTTDKFCESCGDAIVEMATPEVEEVKIEEAKDKKQVPIKKGKLDEKQLAEFEKEEINAAMVRAETGHFGDITPAIEAVAPQMEKELPEQEIPIEDDSKKDNFFKLDNSSVKFFSFKGRLARLEYFILILKIWAIYLGCGFATEWFANNNTGSMIVFLFLVVNIVLGLANFGAMVRRLHDLDKSGWWVLVVFIPIVGILFQIYLLFVRGISGKNRYGLRRI